MANQQQTSHSSLFMAGLGHVIDYKHPILTNINITILQTS